ncbi:MAG: hypothetical protein U0V87_15810 [Acidobacteriota bacterium]
MMDMIHYDPSNLRSRWLAYFDLLGITDLLKSSRSLEVFRAYSIAVEQLHKRLERKAKVSATWFSDSFLLWSEDNSGQSFASIEQAARWFIFFLLQAEIPTRGAISCGEFYADRAHNILFGTALLEAYRFSEAQDWIGLIATPSMTCRLEELGLPLDERLNWVRWPVPFKADASAKEDVGACILGESSLINGRNTCVDRLTTMMNRCSDERTVSKYRRTIEFVSKNQRRLPCES